MILHSDGSQISSEQQPCQDYTPGQRGNSGGQDDKNESLELFNNSDAEHCDYVLNVHTKKIHKPDCGSVGQMGEKNRAYYKGDLQMLKDNGYTGCGSCNP